MSQKTPLAAACLRTHWSGRARAACLRTQSRTRPDQFNFASARPAGIIVSHQSHYLVASEVCGNCCHRQLPQMSCQLPSDFHHLISTGEPLSLQLVCKESNHSVD